MEIPSIIVSQKITLTEVMKSNTLQLISKSDMKRMEFKLKLENSTLEINVRSLELNTSSGHYNSLLKERDVKIENVHMAA